MKLRTLATLSLLLAVASCKQGEEKSQVAQPQTYKLLTISPKEIVLNHNYSASIRGEQDIKIVPRVDGYLTKIATTEGKKVREGETLFVIDQVPYIAALEAAKAAVSVAEANVATAQLNYESKKALFEQDVVSKFDLTATHNQLKTAQAGLLQAKAQQTSASNNLSYTVVKSPANGVVGKLPFRKGDYVSPATPGGLTMVSNNNNMYIYYSMTENQILDMIQEYGCVDSAIVKMPQVELELSNQSIYAHKGSVEAISGVVDATTGAVSIRAMFPNPEGQLLSGASGRVVMPYTLTDAIVIPQEATYEIQGNVYTYKVIDGKAVTEAIEIEKTNNGKEYVVLSGLKQGDVIIAEGAGLVREGTLVKE